MAVVVAAVGLAPTAVAAPVQARATTSAPYCGITWGSQPKTTAEPATPPALTNIRAGRHDCYDRLVFDIHGGTATGYQVRYVANMTGPDGAEVPLRGAGTLSITLNASTYYDSPGGPTYRCTDCGELVDVSGYSTFRQVAWAGSSYRRSTMVGLGVRALLPFRVSTLPGRLVVDVAHHW